MINKDSVVENWSLGCGFLDWEITLSAPKFKKTPNILIGQWRHKKLVEKPNSGNCVP